MKAQTPKTDTQLILKAVKQFSEDVDRRLNGVDQSFDTIDKRLIGMDKKFSDELNAIRSDGLTKDFFTKKLDESHGKLVGAINRADQRTVGVIQKLDQKKILRRDETQELLAIQLFER